MIALSRAQIAELSGNAIEPQGEMDRVLALSSRALRALTSAQLTAMESSATPMPLDVATIEMAGGSIRCMLAGIHLSRR